MGGPLTRVTGDDENDRERFHRTCADLEMAGIGMSDKFKPTKEQDADHIRTVSTGEPGWSMTYEVECLVCGRGFTVDQRDGQITTWKWNTHGEKRARA